MVSGWWCDGTAYSCSFYFLNSDSLLHSKSRIWEYNNLRQDIWRFYILELQPSLLPAAYQSPPAAATLAPPQSNIVDSYFISNRPCWLLRTMSPAQILFRASSGAPATQRAASDACLRQTPPALRSMLVGIFQMTFNEKLDLCLSDDTPQNELISQNMCYC